MSYFNRVQRLSETVTGDDGKERSAAKCVACSLVWGSISLAIDCAMRNHRNRYYVDYYPDHVINGVTYTVEAKYLRQAIRRDGPKPVPSSPVLEPVAQAARPAAPASLEDVRAMAMALGYRLSRIPVKASVTPATPEGVAEVLEPQDEAPIF